MEDQEGRRLAVSLTCEFAVALAPRRPITREGEFVIDVLGITEKKVILVPLDTGRALHGEIRLAIQRPLPLLVHGKHNVIQCVDNRIINGNWNC